MALAIRRSGERELAREPHPFPKSKSNKHIHGITMFIAFYAI